MPDPLSWLLIVLCLIGSFFCSASETAISGVNRFKMQIKADDGSKTAKLVLKLCDKYDRALTTVLIGNNIVAVAISSISTLLFYKYLKDSGLSNDIISLLSSIIISFVVYVLGDTFPKTIARQIPDTISMIFAWPIYFFMILVFPITILFELLSKATEKLFKVKDASVFTEEDFENVVEKVSDEGILDEEQSDIIQSALDYIDTDVKEVLTPRDKIFAISYDDLTNDKIQNIIINTNYSRIPVYDGTLDNIVGVLNIKIYFDEYVKDCHLDIRSILQKPYFILPSVKIDDLFKGFKKHHTHIAFVKDKNKRIIGMVTMEDVLEELVSDISEPTAVRSKK